MLHVVGSAKRLCDGISRREVLRAGGLGLFGLSMADLAAADKVPRTVRVADNFGKAKACILLYLYGAPSQLETFDLKPNASDQVRGEFKPISTTVPGVQICEHLPRTAQVMHRTTLIRSLTHPYNIHSSAYALTGIPTTDIPMELNPRDSRHWPFFGSVLDYLQTRGRPAHDGTAAPFAPANVALPWRFSSRSEPFRRGGPYGGFLGSAYDPVWAEFAGAAPDGDPYSRITPQGRFEFNPPDGAPIILDRLDQRRDLLQQLEHRQRGLDRAATRGFARQHEMAFNMLRSPGMRRALDLDREPRSVRDRYGMSLFGQSALTARRLVEAGVRLVTVFWDEFQEANSAWDTHIHQYDRLKKVLLPGFDHAYSALLGDLDARGLLDETLVVCFSEHGRTPTLNNAPGGGREHWSWAYCGLLAGAGIRQGQVLGSTDAVAGYPRDRPVSPKDVLHTIYHLMGIDPHTELQDRLGRPVPLVAGGEVMRDALG
jgi:hypothetical protein